MGQWAIPAPFPELFSNRHFNITVLACPDISPPNGSYILNGTLTSRTFLCELGTVFPDSKERTRILECRNGKWNESVVTIPNCTGENHFFIIITYFFNESSSCRTLRPLLTQKRHLTRGHLKIYSLISFESKYPSTPKLKFSRDKSPSQQVHKKKGIDPSYKREVWENYFQSADMLYETRYKEEAVNNKLTMHEALVLIDTFLTGLPGTHGCPS